MKKIRNAKEKHALIIPSTIIEQEYAISFKNGEKANGKCCKYASLIGKYQINGRVMDGEEAEKIFGMRVV